MNLSACAFFQAHCKMSGNPRIYFFNVCICMPQIQHHVQLSVISQAKCI